MARTYVDSLATDLICPEISHLKVTDFMHDDNEEQSVNERKKVCMMMVMQVPQCNTVELYCEVIIFTRVSSSYIQKFVTFQNP